jgi:two-component system sensor histidine kinase PilS (NtrC family)
MNDQNKRLTYLMLFRVGVVTLLLGVTFLSELASATRENEPDSGRASALLGLIAVTYALTIGFALALQRARTDGALRRISTAQVSADLLLTTALVHLTGGFDSGFVFMYLLVIVSASFVMGRSAMWTAAGALVLYAGLLAARRFLPLLGQAPSSLPLKDLVRTTTVNGVAFLATGVLSARLSVELRSAGEQIVSQDTRLRDLAALHADVIRSLTSGLVTLSREGTITTYNAAAAEILGVPPTAAVGRPLDQVLPELPPVIRPLGERASLRRSEINHRDARGLERILGVSLSPLYDSEGNVLGRILSFQDLTELRQMEETVARSQRLAAIGRLAAGVAHEIRNPLAAISGSVELLAQSASVEGESRELMSIVTREAVRLNGLITELLDFARPRAPDPQRLDLSATVAEMLRVFSNDRQLDGARVKLSTNGAVPVDADPGQLRQVLWNLVRNACQADANNGPVDVAVGTVESDGARWARLAVRDRGPGIDEEQRARLFEPFFTTKEGGTGLGLATVHRIVEEHKGTVRASSRSDGGAEFEVLLPFAI